MKKIGIMFFLILAVALVSCNQESGAKEKEETPNTGGSDKPEPKAKTPEQLKKEAEAKKLAEETKAALTSLQKARDEYSKEISDAKTAFDTNTSTQKKVEIPADVKNKNVVKEKDLPNVYASLGYENALIDKLNESIKALSINSGKNDEITVVVDALKMLADLSVTTDKILGVHLSNDKLEKINDKATLAKAKEELGKFIELRKEFIASVKKSIEEAYKEKNTSDNVKRELKKIGDTTAPESSAVAGDTGYANARAKAIEDSEKALKDLVKQ
nr:hypothetical protein LKV13_04960 [Borrelia sp. BU AG58]